MQSGYFSRSSYDNSVYDEGVYQSTSPYEYVMSTDRIHNRGGCLNDFGPISSLMGAGVSSPTGDVIAASQANIDVDSILSNRNVPISKAKMAKVNPVNIVDLKTQYVPPCTPSISSDHTRLTDPAMFFRGAAINRFIDPLRDPQANIFYDFAVNTRLEAKDNFFPDIETPHTDWTYNRENQFGEKCNVQDINYNSTAQCNNDYCMSCDRDQVFGNKKKVSFLD